MHKNSYIVHIHRAASFLGEAQDKSAEEYFSMGKQSVGSYWEKANSKKIGSGLEDWEINLLLPMYTEVPANHPEFLKKVNDFYRELSTPVPYKTGKELEIGLMENNGENISETNMPLDTYAYICYRHALGHPFVAENKEAAEANATARFFIFDKDTVLNSEGNNNNEMDSALEIYLDVKNDEDKVDMILVNLGLDPRSYKGKNKITEKQALLKKTSQKDPKAFIKVATDKSIETRAWINNMVTAGVLKKVGTRLMEAEDMQELGSSPEEAVLNFVDPKFSQLVILLKARYEEATGVREKPKATRATKKTE